MIRKRMKEAIESGQEAVAFLNGMNKQGKPKKGYWYYTTYRECVLCGYSSCDKERRYDKRPEKITDRYTIEQFACCDHF